MSFAICASSRIASSVRCIISFAVGESVRSAFSVGFGCAASEGTLLSCVKSSCVWRSSICTRSLASAMSSRCVSLGSTGSGVFARRSASVLPPPSRLACARMSAFCGRSFVFALTSAISSGGPRSNMRLRSAGAK